MAPTLDNVDRRKISSHIIEENIKPLLPKIDDDHSYEMPSFETEECFDEEINTDLERY